ncbi:MAG: glutaminyl-peptide cyclotransferase, partial [Mucinivorans sp.]
MSLRKYCSSFVPIFLGVILISCGASAQKQKSESSQSQSQSTENKVVAAPKFHTAKIVNTYNHDQNAYTQGLLFDGGQLYESTGQYGLSSLREVDLATGKVVRNQNLSSDCFGEGLALEGGKLYQLTWREGKIFVYEAKTFRKVATYDLNGEGWGITSCDGKLYVSNGSSTIQVFRATDLTVIGQFEVVSDRGPVAELNELEWIDGRIWANIYMSSMVAIINPESGVVEAMVDCSALGRRIKNPKADVQNGIAYDSVGRKVYMTGKNWEKLFEIEL